MSTHRESLAFLNPPQAADEIGRLGKYRILKVIGQGGMGVVFQAEDPTLKRTVALKAMLPDVVKRPTAKERFLREARATASIEHDHIVTIYEVGEDRGVPYLAMQFLKGLTLDNFLKKKQGNKTGVPLPLDHVLKLGREIAKGLAAAHDVGLIHRDIKPANLWLDSSAGGRVKILDFGLARAAEGDSQLTQIGVIVGTAAYMAPEQAKSSRIDNRADLFSLGCVLYRLCSGRLPFQGRDTTELLISVAMDTPTPVHELNPELPPNLSRLVMKLLAKKPEDRPASAKAVVEAIQALERDQSATPQQVGVVPVSTAGPVAAAVAPAASATMWQEPAADRTPPLRPFRARSRRSPLLIPAMVLGVLALAAGAAILAINSGRRDKEESLLAREGGAVAPSGKGKDSATSRTKDTRDTRPREVIDTRPKELPKDTRPREPDPVKAPPPDPRPDVKYITNSIGMKLAPIPAGEFLMGTSADDVARFQREPSGYGGPDNKETPSIPQHKVKITKPFYLGAYTVTQGQYEKVMGLNPSDAKHKLGPDFPVDSVSAEDGAAFCKKLSELPDEKKAGRVYRLPTEAEWEYACRAGTTTTTAYGKTLSSKQANFDGAQPLGNVEKGNKIGHPVKVGSYPPNGWGLYDMHGNLWQWCLDGPRKYTADPVVDPRGPDLSGPKMEPARVLRGGCWRDGAVSASFRKSRAGYRINIVGFRVVCEE